MSYETIAYEVLEEGIGVLALNRPRLFNAVNYQMIQELEDFWKARLFDLGTRVIIFKGNGEKAFSAGLSMKETLKLVGQMDAGAFYAFQARLSRITLAMRQVPQPIICAVHGPAVGLGFSFALASDVRLVSPEARFSAAYINIGLGGADMACSYFLPRVIGAGRAYEFMLTGNFMSAEEAMTLGLASRLVPRESLMDTALDLARNMNGKNPVGLRLTKEAVNMNLDAPSLEHALQMEDRNQTMLVLRGQLEKGEKSSRYF